MTRSIFDPNGRETERSGSTFGPEDAGNRSKLPPDVIDGKVETAAADASDVQAIADAQKSDPDTIPPATEDAGR